MRSRIYWMLMISVLLVVVGCKDKSQNAGNGAGNWPDNPQPLVGWFTIGSVLYYVDSNGEATLKDSSGQFDFILGSLPTKSTGWAMDDKIYEIKSEEWKSFSVQPQCPNGKELIYQATARFADGSGHVTALCEDTGYGFYWDGSQWDRHKFPNFNTQMSCLSRDYCVYFNAYYSILLFSNGEYKEIGDSEIFREVHNVIIMNKELYYAIGMAPPLYSDDDTDSDDAGPFHLMKFENNRWTASVKLDEIDNLFLDAPLIRRIDQDHLAISYHTGDDFGRTIVLDGSEEVIDPEWPEYFELAFAAGGSGLGLRHVDYPVLGIDLIHGLERETIYEFNGEEQGWISFFVAADAD